MIYAVLSLSAALVAVTYLLLRSQAAERAAVASERQSWVAERRELLNRIQKPEFLPNETPEQWTMPEDEPDDTALVGTTVYSDADFADLAAELGTDED